VEPLEPKTGKLKKQLTDLPKALKYAASKQPSWLGTPESKNKMLDGKRRNAS